MKKNNEKSNDINLAVITSTVPLSKEQTDKLKQALKKIFAKDLTIENIIDRSILGGFSVKVGDWYVDATLLNDLKNLSKIL